MPFVSEIIGMRTADVDGKTIGNTVDLISQQSKELPHQIITALKGRFSGEERILPVTQLCVTAIILLTECFWS